MVMDKMAALKAEEDGETTVLQDAEDLLSSTTMSQDLFEEEPKCDTCVIGDGLIHFHDREQLGVLGKLKKRLVEFLPVSNDF